MQMVKATKAVEVEGILKPWHNEPDKPKKIKLKEGATGIVQDNGVIEFECGSNFTIAVPPDNISVDAYTAI